MWTKSWSQRSGLTWKGKEGEESIWKEEVDRHGPWRGANKFLLLFKNTNKP